MSDHIETLALDLLALAVIVAAVAMLSGACAAGSPPAVIVRIGADLERTPGGQVREDAGVRGVAAS